MMKNNFFQTYIENAEKTPDKVLLRIDEKTLTYREFLGRTSVVASGMKALGIGVDDKIGIIMPNSIEWYIVFWSAIKIGRAHV